MALEPEQSNNANLGFFGTWRPAAGHTLYYEANGFLRNVDNFIQVQVIEKEGMLQYKNVPAVHIKGAEGEVRYNWQNKLQISGNLSYQDARDQQQYKTDGKPSATYNNRLPNRPWLFGGAEVNYVFHHVGLPDSRLRLNFNYQWVHWYFLTWEAYGSYENKSRIPTQHICNAGVSYSWKTTATACRWNVPTCWTRLPTTIINCRSQAGPSLPNSEFSSINPNYKLICIDMKKSSFY